MGTIFQSYILIKNLIFFVLLSSCVGCYAPVRISTTINTIPTRPFRTTPTKIVVVNAFDVNSTTYRDNKKKLFEELTQLAVKQIEDEFKKKGVADVTSEISVLSLIPKPDSTVNSLIVNHNASHAVIIKSFDAYFNKTDVVVTEHDNGTKSREASYDIIVDIRYSLYERDRLYFDTLISASNYFSSRGVVSGFLAAGPNIVNNADAATEGLQQNIEMYLRSFFVEKTNRERVLINNKDFEKVCALAQGGKYDEAFQLSKELMNTTNSNKGSKAAYNCAVLLEAMERYDEAEYYLMESEKLEGLFETKMMLIDYRKGYPYKFIGY